MFAMVPFTALRVTTAKRACTKVQWPAADHRKIVGYPSRTRRVDSTCRRLCHFRLLDWRAWRRPRCGAGLLALGLAGCLAPATEPATPAPAPAAAAAPPVAAGLQVPGTF